MNVHLYAHSNFKIFLSQPVYQDPPTNYWKCKFSGLSPDLQNWKLRVQASTLWFSVKDEQCWAVVKLMKTDFIQSLLTLRERAEPHSHLCRGDWAFYFILLLFLKSSPKDVLIDFRERGR